jgi:hypothetical protein
MFSDGFFCSESFQPFRQEKQTWIVPASVTHLTVIPGDITGITYMVER